MYCSECGKEIADNSEFCGYCGTALGAAAAQAAQPPAPPGPQAYAPPPPPTGAAPPAPPPPPPGTPSQAGPYAPPPKKSLLPWILGGIGVLAVVAIVLVLVFVVFGGDDTATTSGDNSELTGPEEVVARFFEALQDQDAEMLLNTFEPSFRKEFKKALGDDYEKFFKEYFFAAFPDDLEVEIRKMETEIDGDTAVVTVVDGTMSYTDEYGDEVTEEASEGEMDPAVLVKVNGKWYLSGEAAKAAGFDPEMLEDLDLDEGSSDGDTGEEGGTSTDTAAGDDSMVEVVLPIDSKEEAFSALLEDPYVAQWYAESIYAFYSAEEQADRYVLFLFEQPYAGEQTPYGWFGVDKETGETYEITNE